MWSIIVWVVVGGLAGWVASMIMKTNENQGLVGNIIVGILGGLLGGFLVGMLGGEGFTGFNIWSFFVALLGSGVLIFLWRLMSGKGRASE